ncbi:MAG: hypothetical protein KJO76_11905 [Gammaproteobacteria bacterium]|nr:hypothetical protein [Gammaproteobacteria bacterium]
MAPRIVVAMTVLAIMAGCGGQPVSPFVQQLDESTGESLLRVRDPLRLVAEQPALSRVGKDYLFAMPVSVSGSDEAGTYLWFGFGSTTDRTLTGASLPNVKQIVLFVDGTPMTFDLRDWSAIVASEPFDPGVVHYASFGARVTQSQLRRIAAATGISAYVTNADSRSPVYKVAGGAVSDWASL